MHKRISFIRIVTLWNHTIEVIFLSRNGVKAYVFPNPTNDSLYRLLNNSQVQDICAYNEAPGLMLEITPK